MIHFFVMDIDGTLTDGKLYIGQSGEMMKAFDVKDGYAVAVMLPRAGIIPVVITGRQSNIVSERCKELGITECHQGSTDKLASLTQLIDKYSVQEQTSFSLADVAYIGDDLPDLECVEAVTKAGGITACPNDAIREVKDACTFVCGKNGGCGAVREFVEYLTKDAIVV